MPLLSYSGDAVPHRTGLTPLFFVQLVVDMLV